MQIKEYEALLDLFVDGELGAEELLRVQKHLEECPHCRAYVDDAFAMSLAFPDAEETALPEGFHESVMARIAAESAPVVKKSNQRRWWKTLAPMAAACFAVMLLANRGGVLHSEKEAAQAPAAASYAMDFTTAEEGEYAEEAPAAPTGDGSVSISATAEHAPMERIAAGTEAITADQEFSACAQPVLALTLTADEAGETGFFAGMEPMEWSDGSGGYLLSWEEFETLLSLLPEAEPAEDLPIGEAVFVRIQD